MLFSNEGILNFMSLLHQRNGQYRYMSLSYTVSDAVSAGRGAVDSRVMSRKRAYVVVLMYLFAENHAFSWRLSTREGHCIGFRRRWQTASSVRFLPAPQRPISLRGQILPVFARHLALPQLKEIRLSCRLRGRLRCVDSRRRTALVSALGLSTILATTEAEARESPECGDCGIASAGRIFQWHCARPREGRKRQMHLGGTDATLEVGVGVAADVLDREVIDAQPVVVVQDVENTEKHQMDAPTNKALSMTEKNYNRRCRDMVSSSTRYVPRDKASCNRKVSAQRDSLLASSEDDDVRFIRMALRLAELAHEDGEVPVGAVLTETVIGANGRRRVLATGRNKVERRSDASAHAEMLCLQTAAKVRENWRLAGSTLYVTVEPCAMCLSAAQLFRVDRVVYGTPNPNLGACGGWVDLHSRKHAFHDLEVQGGVLADECALLLRRFFRLRRRRASNVSPTMLPITDSGFDTWNKTVASSVGENTGDAGDVTQRH